MSAPLLIASNRGPVSWIRSATGGLVARRGSGGLVSALGALQPGPELTWVCAAITDADRAASRDASTAQPGVQLLDLDPETFRLAYNGVANGALWFTAHLLWSLASSPTFDARTQTEWAAYQAYSVAFADALAAAAAPGAAVLVQDYHLSLVPALLRARRPDLRISHFSHTPWAPPEYFALLPELRALVGDRQLLLRIDRTELSKNIVRGFAAYADLLRRHPEHRGRVVHLAFAYPSRHDLAEYRAYTEAVQQAAAAVNAEFGEPGWQPVHLEVKDDYARSLAAYTLADVLLVNPLRDGMNLVAKEGPVLSRRGVSLVLSREAGAAEELGAHAHLVSPLDVTQTADALHDALTTSPALRLARTAALTAAATAHPPAAWLQAQLTALAPAPSARSTEAAG